MCLEKFFLKMLMPHSGHSTMSGLPAMTSQVTSQNPSHFVSSAQAMGTSVVLLEIDQSCKVLATHVTRDTCRLRRVSPLHVPGHAPRMQPLPALATRNLPLPRPGPWKYHPHRQDPGQHRHQQPFALFTYKHRKHTLKNLSPLAHFFSPARFWSWSIV